MADKYYIYRPLLDLIGKAEGTDRGRKYNETLGYGLLTAGPVNLTAMSLREVDDLQTRMLAHPKNKWNSSAVGRYQIVRTTLRVIKKALRLSDNINYSAGVQDMMAVYLLNRRGLSAYLDKRLSESNLINNLAQEWASFPKTDGKGHYGGQRASITPTQVRRALAQVQTLSPLPVQKPLYKSREMAGAGMTAGGAAGAAVADHQTPDTSAVQDVQDVITQTSDGLFGLMHFSDVLMWMFVLISMAGIGLSIYAVLDRRKKERENVVA